MVESHDLADHFEHQMVTVVRYVDILLWSHGCQHVVGVHDDVDKRVQ